MFWRAQQGEEKGSLCISGMEGQSIHTQVQYMHLSGKRHFPHLPSGCALYSGRAVEIHLQCCIIGAWHKKLKRKRLHQAPKDWLQAQQSGWKGTEMAMSHKYRVTSERGYQLVPSQSGFRRSCFLAPAGGIFHANLAALVMPRISFIERGRETR